MHQRLAASRRGGPELPNTPTVTGERQPEVAVVIPAYRAADRILGVIAEIGDPVKRVYVVDDACPEGTGDLVERRCTDPRVAVLRHPVNLGVGGAMVTGYRRALADGADIVVKMDADGQMDPSLLPLIVAPIAAGAADYVKGNRFYRPEDLAGMPPVRLFGNACLSLLTKVSSGYWTVFDPTNGYTAIHARVLAVLGVEKLHPRYFFESDMLYRLNIVRARVVDMPMPARYAGEKSSLRISRVLFEFPGLHLRNAAKRVLYNYVLRDFSVASLELAAGAALLTFGLVYGASIWIGGAIAGEPSSPGAVMLAALPFLAGLQLLLAFLSYDINSVPTTAVHPLLPTPVPAAGPAPVGPPADAVREVRRPDMAEADASP